MKYIVLFFPLFLLSLSTPKPHLSGADLLEIAIKYHDPENQWATLERTFYIEESRPSGTLDTVELYLNNRNGDFKLSDVTASVRKMYEIKNGTYQLSLNGSSDISKEDAEKYRMNKKWADFMKNYYSYLWGLPMKLKDPGTIVHDKVEEEVFDKVACYKMKVTYERGVGTDTWYFYFKKNDYSLHGYKFYKDESKNDGEFITLEGQVSLSGIKFPQTRKWYYNNNDKYLGTDRLLAK